MNRILIFSLCVIMCAGLSSCAGTQKKEQSSTTDTKVFGDEVKVRIEIRDIAIENPDSDRRSYYKIYIDKIEAGRTEIGLESQTKRFETTLDPNQHLLSIEKYVLDKKNNRYKKVNNIEQPKPEFIYFDTIQTNSVTIDVHHDVQSHETRYGVHKR